MSRCPKCKEDFKGLFIENIFRVNSNKLNCNYCNSKIKITKKTNKINSILANIPLVLIIFWGHDILSFLTGFTHNNSISKWILICIIAIWGILVYNYNFPWVEFEEII